MLAVVACVFSALPASAAAPPSTYDPTVHAYDAPALLPSPDTVATEARGLPSGSGAGSWVGPLSVREYVVATNGVSKFGSLTHSSAGIAPFSTQRAITIGQRGAIQAHHLIERRFARQIGGNTDDWASIVVTRSEHQVFTNAWRQAIPYGAGTRTASRAQIEGAARQIYADYPEILQALGLG